MNTMSDINNKVNENSLDQINEQRKKYITRGTSGLVNIGNTCYMNSAIQLMCATDQLVSYLRGTDGTDNARYKDDLRRNITKTIVENEKKRQNINKNEENEENDEKNNETKYEININKMRKKFKNSLTYKFRNVICAMWGSNRKIKPYAFKEKLGEINKEFIGWNQNDSQECLSLILDTMHEETKSEIILLMKPLDEKTEMVRQTKKKFETLKNSKAQQEYIKYKNENLSECAKIEALEFWKNYLKKNNSMIEHIFGGLFFGTIKCGKCTNSSFKFEPFRIINLHLISTEPNNEIKLNIDPVTFNNMSQHDKIRYIHHIRYMNSMQNEKDITLEECLKNYFGDEEKLEGDCQYFCDYCNCKNDAIKTTHIWYCPQKLIIQLKRFDNIMKKNNRTVIFPIKNLDMSPYMSKYTKGNCIYDLYGISYHSGSVRGGHYTAYTKNPINNMWYYYDDSNIVHIDESELQSRLVTNGAYILMYEARREFVSAMPDQNENV